MKRRKFLELQARLQRQIDDSLSQTPNVSEVLTLKTQLKNVMERLTALEAAPRSNDPNSSWITASITLRGSILDLTERLEELEQTTKAQSLSISGLENLWIKINEELKKLR